MKIFVFNKSKVPKSCGNGIHMYVPNQFAGVKVAGIIVADDNENIVYQHTQLKKCADCAIVQALGK